MATSGSTSVAVTNYDTLKFTWTEKSQSITDNTTTVTWKLQLIASSSGYINSTASKSWSVTVNGVKYSGSNTVGIANNATKTLASGTTTIAHSADGTKTFSYSFSQQFSITFSGESIGTKSGSGKGTLDTIPRATTPTVSASSVYMGSAVTISTPRAASAFTHDLAYSFLGGSYVSIATGVGTSYSWTTPDLASKIPNVTSGTVTIRCITKNGSTTIGTKTVTMTLKVPADVVPTISSIAVTEATEDIAAQFGAFVKGMSTLSVSVTAAGAKGSTIASCKTTLDGVKYDGLNFTSGVLATAGSLSLVATVTDSRGRSVSFTKKISVLDYYLPEVVEFTAYRVDEAGNAKDDGEYLRVEYAYKVAPVNNKNTATMTVDYKRSAATSWEKPLLTKTDLEGSGDRKFTTKFSSDYQFDICLKVVDWFGEEASYTVVLPTAKVILDLKANGNGIAFGKTSEFDGFELAMPTQAESFKMMGVRQHEIGESYGHVLYNSGLLLQWGAVSITPTAINTVTQAVINFPIPYAERPHISGTLMANSPQVVSWGMGVGDTAEASLTSLRIYMNRSTLHATTIRWMALGLVDQTKLPEVTAE